VVLAEWLKEKGADWAWPELHCYHCGILIPSIAFKVADFKRKLSHGMGTWLQVLDLKGQSKIQDQGLKVVNEIMNQAIFWRKMRASVTRTNHLMFSVLPMPPIVVMMSFVSNSETPLAFSLEERKKGLIRVMARWKMNPLLLTIGTVLTAIHIN